jgi:hypothetical protein
MVIFDRKMRFSIQNYFRIPLELTPISYNKQKFQEKYDYHTYKLALYNQK